MARNTPGEPPKCKYSVVTLQTCNVVFAIIMLSLSGKSNRLEENPPFNWTALISLIALLLVFAGIKFFLRYKEHKNPGGYNPKDRCRRDLLIGYGAISICGYIPLIVMYVIGYHPVSDNEKKKFFFQNSDFRYVSTHLLYCPRSFCHLESCSSDSLDSYSVKFVRTEINHKPGWQTGATTEEFCNFGYCDGAEKSAENWRADSGIVLILF
ncbi:hypothetical protein CAEBREN_21423 [Caenorhabditis brenneri]|uniref:Uncharacterized protein n=1 Tax=Caenorhabditis brenneri TaxID=135651 RepID=G0N7Z0_CAEBE|nr:hypothetical protein CAEBREN_21423 [Caenorhabditis brenneri]